MKKFSEYLVNPVLNESSLSRLRKHMQEHDSGTITAFRGKFTKKENEDRNYRLRAKLHDKRYDITSVKGSCIENYGSPNAEEVGEDVFFVVDSNDTGNLEKDLRELGSKYCQDFIMIIPKGGTTGIMWGTSKPECESKNPYPKYGEKEVLPNAVWGKEGQFMTKVRGRPFIFKESYEEGDIVEYELPQGYTARYGCHAVASNINN
jgi:hypothetical protein